MKTLFMSVVFVSSSLALPAIAAESCDQKARLTTSVYANVSSDDPTTIIQKCMTECQQKSGGSQDQLQKCLMECIMKTGQ